MSDGLDMWTIYDVGHEYTARCWRVTPGEPQAQLTGHSMSATDLGMLRRLVRAMTGCDQVFVRQEYDEPEIVETWL